jgi:hypothetical protein
VDEITTGLIAGVVGGGAGYVSALLTNIIQRRAVIDESVRTIRAESYAVIWRRMSLLPLWPRARGVTFEQILNMSEDLRDWYFGQAGSEQSHQTLSAPQATTDSGPSGQLHTPGGMYLSTEARRAYVSLQNHLNALVNEQHDGLDTELPLETYDSIQERCSSLRTEITRDLLSRRRAFMVG